MRKRTVFLQWALFACLVILGAYVGVQQGWTDLVADDPSHTSLVTLCVFPVAMLMCGRIAWLHSAGRDPRDLAIDWRVAHYGSSLCVSIGLIGTALGYIIMFMHGMSFTGKASEAMVYVFGDAKRALVNTAIGGMTGVLIEVQAQFLKFHLAKAKRKLERAEAEDDGAGKAAI